MKNIQNLSIQTESCLSNTNLIKLKSLGSFSLSHITEKKMKDFFKRKDNMIYLEKQTYWMDCYL